MNWLDLPENKQKELFEQLSYKTGLSPQAIEKDAWVTLALKMLFTSEIATHLTFKGGTSLSKVYRLINRFSEDIDISIDRGFLGFKGNLTKGEIRKLRRKSHDFTLHVMSKIIKDQLTKYQIEPNLYEIIVENTKISDQDPETIKINYKSVFSEIEYIPQRVLIEIGARSSSEPFERKQVNSIIDEYFSNLPISEKPLSVNVIRPEKTLLEKMILLHEEFSKPNEKIRHFRMSRHYYGYSTNYCNRLWKKRSPKQRIIQPNNPTQINIHTCENCRLLKIKNRNLKIIPK